MDATSTSRRGRVRRAHRGRADVDAELLVVLLVVLLLQQAGQHGGHGLGHHVDEWQQLGQQLGAAAGRARCCSCCPCCSPGRRGPGRRRRAAAAAADPTSSAPPAMLRPVLVDEHRGRRAPVVPSPDVEQARQRAAWRAGWAAGRAQGGRAAGRRRRARGEQLGRGDRCRGVNERDEPGRSPNVPARAGRPVSSAPRSSSWVASDLGAPARVPGRCARAGPHFTGRPVLACPPDITRSGEPPRVDEPRDGVRSAPVRSAAG